MSGAYPFTVTELDRIAEHLGITTQGILDSAALGDNLRANRLDAIPPLPAPKPRDAWAQPPGSFRRKASPRRSSTVEPRTYPADSPIQRDIS
ncbi:hypothetical protein [Microbacterium maritypicum]|uniref:hypothetical protein n=1 Tax=Microbacterium maritypicum TaxID=33918 RepID=UPI0034621780